MMQAVRMTRFVDVSTPAKRFRLIALWEAVTWAALLVAMVFKWGFGYEEAVRIPGMVHGITGFLAFVLIALTTARALQWSPKVIAMAIVSSVPPFGSVVFERWAVRYGLMAELSLTVPSDAEDEIEESTRHGRVGARS